MLGKVNTAYVPTYMVFSNIDVNELSGVDNNNHLRY